MMRKMNASVGMTCLGGPKVETPEAMGVVSILEMEMLLVQETRVIPAPPPIVTTLTHPLLIRTKS